MFDSFPFFSSGLQAGEGGPLYALHTATLSRHTATLSRQQLSVKTGCTRRKQQAQPGHWAAEGTLSTSMVNCSQPKWGCVVV